MIVFEQNNHKTNLKLNHLKIGKMMKKSQNQPKLNQMFKNINYNTNKAVKTFDFPPVASNCYFSKNALFPKRVDSK